MTDKIEVTQDGRCACSQLFGLHHNPACKLHGLVSEGNHIPDSHRLSSEQSTAREVEQLRAEVERLERAIRHALFQIRDGQGNCVAYNLSVAIGEQPPREPEGAPCPE